MEGQPRGPRWGDLKKAEPIELPRATPPRLSPPPPPGLKRPPSLCPVDPGAALKRPKNRCPVDPAAKPAKGRFSLQTRIILSCIAIVGGYVAIHWANGSTRIWYSVWDSDRLEYVEKDLPDRNARYVQYIDWRTWPGDSIYYRHFWIHDPNRATVYREGPMSASNKPHGQWTEKDLDAHPPERLRWYWYGEEITEGEWHIRADRK
jgi:hypothetical protein